MLLVGSENAGVGCADGMRVLRAGGRALDGARGAQFLGALADLIEEPLALLV